MQQIGLVNGVKGFVYIKLDEKKAGIFFLCKFFPISSLCILEFIIVVSR
jgi:hypothetical protein